MGGTGEARTTQDPDTEYACGCCIDRMGMCIYEASNEFVLGNRNRGVGVGIGARREIQGGGVLGSVDSSNSQPARKKQTEIRRGSAGKVLWLLLGRLVRSSTRQIPGFLASHSCSARRPGYDGVWPTGKHFADYRSALAERAVMAGLLLALTATTVARGDASPPADELVDVFHSTGCPAPE